MNVKNKVYDDHILEFYDKLRDKVCDEVSAQVYLQVFFKVRERVWIQVWRDIGIPMRNQLKEKYG